MATALDAIPAEDFEALVGRSLRVCGDAFETILTVESVWRSPYPTARAVSPGFSLFLRGDAAAMLPQGSYRIDHPQHGELLLFMTPVGRDGGGMRYEIVFN